MTTPDGRRVSICICTYRRPVLLGRLVERIASQATDLPPGVSVGFVVVDDDTERSAEPIVSKLVEDERAAITYSCTGSGNIAVARNRAIELGLATGDLLVMIDDDCMPQDGWLRELCRVQACYDADCVTGHCEDVPPDGAPRWLVEEPFLDRNAPHEEGSEAEVGHIKNILLSTEFLRATGLRFNEQFGTRGGEDALFFHALTAAGVHRRHANRAVVLEPVPASRATLRYQLRRGLWYGNSETLTCLESGRSTRLRMGLRGVLAMFRGLSHPLRQVLGGRPPQLRFAIAQVLRGLGRSLGAVGVPLDHH